MLCIPSFLYLVKSPQLSTYYLKNVEITFLWTRTNMENVDPQKFILFYVFIFLIDCINES